MDREIRVGAVSYLNTKPLLFGLEHSELIRQIDLRIDYPARIAGMLLNDEIDIGLVPVSIIPFLSSWHINTDYCIGADGPVASVCLFSEVPVQDIRTVLLDYQSRTSVQLARILLKEYWKVDPVYVDTRDDFRNQIRGNTAGVVIGDRALEWRKRSSFIYDLGEAWKQHTGLPFVFAAWISNRVLDPGFVNAFNRANKEGLKRLPELLADLQYPHFDLQAYYTRCISYELTDQKRKGLELFLSKLP